MLFVVCSQTIFIDYYSVNLVLKQKLDLLM